MLILRFAPFFVLAATLIVPLAACSTAQTASPSGYAVTQPQMLSSMSDKKPADNKIMSDNSTMVNDQNAVVVKSTVNTTDMPNDYKETVVTRKIAQLSADKNKIENFYNQYQGQLKDIQGRSETTSRDYYSTVAQVNARLQNGTTPGNPILVEQSQQAQQKLESMAGDVSTLTNLSTQISSNASVAAYLLEAVRATYGLSGAVDEDHVALTTLEDDVNRLVVQIDRQLTEVNNDINRRTAYLASERRNLQTMTLEIANGEMYGQNLGNRAFFSPTTALPGDPDIAMARATPANFNPGKPLVVIRFDRPNVEYQQALYMATSEALQHYPNVSFEVVAVAPPGANAAQGSLGNSDAQNDAQNVVRSMTQMGIPSNRIKMSTTHSPAAHSPEVHVFLR